MRELAQGTRRIGWTIAGLLAAIFPHALHMRWWVPSVALAICGWRVLAEVRGWALPGRIVRTLVSLGAAGVILASYQSLTGLDAGTALLVLMGALKLLETRTPRDHVVLVFIGWFLCLAQLLYAQDLVSSLLVLPAVWLLSAALLNVSRRGADGPPLQPFRTTGKMLLKALPMTLVLFLLFPRVAGNFWGVPSQERASTGLSDEMSPGDISELTVNDTVAFRVRFDGEPPPPLQRYWRGPVLTEFDGYTWSRSPAQSYFRMPVEFVGEPVDYTVTLEPTEQRILFALDMPEQWPDQIAEQRWDYQLRTPRPIGAVIQYRARSYPQYRAGTQLMAGLRNSHLQLPAGRNPRSAALAQRMRSEVADDAALVRAILEMFRQQEFYYTLTPPRLDRDSVDDFLFNTRRGFCGHFASAFTMMMRAAGVPARVVGGYQGGDWNSLGGYLIVRQSHAHAWSEVWLEGQGWVRVDPTAAVAPERVERGLDFALPESEQVPGRALRQSELLWQARLAWDVVNARWNDWVVKFSSEDQSRLLDALGFEDSDWQQLALLLGAALAATLGLLSAWLAWEFRGARADQATRSYQRFTARLARRGLTRHAHEAPRDFLRRVREARPDLTDQASAITELYLAARYLPDSGQGHLAELRRRVKGFRP